MRRDVELPIPEPYQGSTAKQNDYRCFLVDPNFTETTTITGFVFEPDKTENVHHALAFRVRADQRDKLAERDEKDEGSGWGCYAGSQGPGGQISPSGTSRESQQLTAWAPGQRPTKYPAGSGVRMEAGVGDRGWGLPVFRSRRLLCHRRDRPGERDRGQRDQGVCWCRTFQGVSPKEV